MNTDNGRTFDIPVLDMSSNETEDSNPSLNVPQKSRGIHHIALDPLRSRMVTGTSDSKIAAVYQFPDLEPIGVLKVIQPLFLVLLCNEFVFRDIGM
jgi:hypothetical protein